MQINPKKGLNSRLAALSQVQTQEQPGHHLLPTRRAGGEVSSLQGALFARRHAAGAPFEAWGEAVAAGALPEAMLT